MIGNIQAYNDDILRQRRRELGHLPIPHTLSSSRVEAAETVTDLGRIPFVGRERIKGFRQIGEPVFVDISGMGQDGEPALSLRQVLAHIKELTKDHGTLAWGLTQVGQFQGHLQAWKVKGA